MRTTVRFSRESTQGATKGSLPAHPEANTEGRKLSVARPRTVLCPVKSTMI